MKVVFGFTNLQTAKTMMKLSILLHFISVFTVCKRTRLNKGFPEYQGYSISFSRT